MEQKNRSSGFASMDSGKQREIARKGGMAAHKKGTAHEFTSDEARNAGRKGGQQVSANRSHMKEIGRLGGKRSAERRRLKGLATHAAANSPLRSDPVSEGDALESEPIEIEEVMDESEENSEAVASGSLGGGELSQDGVQEVRS